MIFPHEVQGWLTEAEGRTLFDLALDKVCLEIGSFCGRSTVCIGQAAKVLHCVDPFNGQASVGPGWTADKLLQNCMVAGISGKLVLYPMLSWDASPLLQGHRFGLVFIDGNHSREACLHDLNLAKSLLAGSGKIAVHDYGHPNWPGVKKAVDEFGKVERLVDGLAILNLG